MSTLLVDQLRHALNGAGQVECPYVEEPPADTVTFEVPLDLQGLAHLFHVRTERAREIMQTAPTQDGGLWFRNSNRADAVGGMLKEALGVRHEGDPHIETRTFHYWSRWRYSFG